jgi:hypothetical protein
MSIVINSATMLSFSTVGSSATFSVKTGFPEGLTLLGYTSAAADPTTTELPTDKDLAIHKNTSSGDVFLAYNNGGIIVKVQLT